MGDLLSLALPLIRSKTHLRVLHTFISMRLGLERAFGLDPLQISYVSVVCG